MHASKHGARSRAAESTHAPWRLFFATITALLVATLIASSAAHGMVLGEASAQSALGSPLRVVIPVTAGPGELLQPDCFQAVPAGGDGSTSSVTARVSLERAAAAPRLVVTTANMVNEPVLRFSIQSECNGLARRAYVLLLDPPESANSMAAQQAMAGEPGQDRPAPQPAATQRRKAASAAPAPAQVVRVPESSVPAPTSAVPAPTQAMQATANPESEQMQAVGVRSFAERGSPAAVIGATGLVGPLALRHVATTPEAIVPIAPLPPRAQPAPSSASSSGWYLVVAGIAAAGVIALLALLLHRRQAPPEIPQWTRSSTYADTRSFTELSASPGTGPHTPSHAGATTSRRGADSAGRKSAPSSRLGNMGTTASRTNAAAIDPTTIDTLLDAIDSDVVEERAVREAWAAARSDVEKEMDGNAILEAIEAAERDLHLAPPPAAQAAIERALEDDLLQPPQRR